MMMRIRMMRIAMMRITMMRIMMMRITMKRIMMMRFTMRMRMRLRGDQGVRQRRGIKSPRSLPESKFNVCTNMMMMMMWMVKIIFLWSWWLSGVAMHLKIIIQCWQFHVFCIIFFQHSHQYQTLKLLLLVHQSVTLSHLFVSRETKAFLPFVVRLSAYFFLSPTHPTHTQINSCVFSRTNVLCCYRKARHATKSGWRPGPLL